MKTRCLLLGLTLAGCAHDGSDRPLSPDAPEAAASVFLSPSGEPFRPTPNGPAPLEQWFARADADSSGALDPAEFRTDADRFFRTADASGDGVIDDGEVQAYERTIAPEISPDFGSRRGPDPNAAAGEADDIIRLPGVRPDGSVRGRSGGRGGPRGGGVLRLIQEPQAILGADADQSRTVSQEEFRRATEARFNVLDTVRDGRLNRAELRLLRPAVGRGRVQDES